MTLLNFILKGDIMSLSHQIITLNSNITTILTTPASEEIPYASSLSISIQNIGAVNVYIGSEDVSLTSFGVMLTPGQTFTADIAPNDELHAIIQAGASDVAVLRVVK